MKASPRAIRLIQEFEGLACEKYRDVGGKWTIGYGHLIRDGETLEKITEDDAVQLLCDDLAAAESIINRFVLAPLTQNQFDALCSFVYNVGQGSASKDGFVRLKSGRSSTMLRKLNACDYAGASDEFPKWSHVGARQVPGLLRRRLAEQLLFNAP